KGREPTIAYANEEFLNVIGCNIDEIIGKNPRNMFGKQTDKQLIDEIKTVLKENRTWQGPIIVYDKDANHQVLYFNIVPVYNFVNEVMYYACFGSKIDETKEHYNAKADAHLDNFVNTLFAQNNYLRDISEQIPTGI